MSIWQIKSDQMYCRNKIFFPYLNRNIDNINIKPINTELYKPWESC